jgi:hypothetical protein
VIDHLVYATDDLERTVAAFTERFGVVPTPGGRHLGWGTRNELVGLGDGTYLELVGPDRDQADPDGPRPFGIDDLEGERLVTWCARPEGTIEGARTRALAVGHDVGAVAEMSRRRPDDVLLSWRLTAPVLNGAFGGVVPFVIDWLASEHPTTSLGAPLALESLHLHTPHPREVLAIVQAIGPDPRLMVVDDTEVRVVARLTGGTTFG